MKIDDTKLEKIRSYVQEKKKEGLSLSEIIKNSFFHAIYENFSTLPQWGDFLEKWECEKYYIIKEYHKK